MNMHPARATPAPGATRDASRLTGEVYGRLINLSGRRRFTSQRVVLYAVLALQGRPGSMDASKEALVNFMDAHAALVDGNADLPGVFCQELREAYFGAAGGDSAIRAFASLAQRTHEAIQTRARSAAALLDQLVDSATPLLVSLNGITQVYEDLARRQAAGARKQLFELMGEIQSIARHARIVSSNAQIVAARAQGSGREFSVVAAELSQITTRMDEMVREAMRTSAP